MTLLSLSFIFPQPSQQGPETAGPPAPYPCHSLRRLPQCPPVHLSHPVLLSLPMSLSPNPGQLRPLVPPPHRAAAPHIHAVPRGASFRAAPNHNSCRTVTVSAPSVFFTWKHFILWCYSQHFLRHLQGALAPRHSSYSNTRSGKRCCSLHLHTGPLWCQLFSWFFRAS